MSAGLEPVAVGWRDAAQLLGLANLKPAAQRKAVWRITRRHHVKPVNRVYPVAKLREIFGGNE